MSSTTHNSSGSIDESQNDDLKIGIAGYGGLGDLSGQAVQDIDGAEVVAVADADEKHLKNAMEDLDNGLATYNTRGKNGDLLDKGVFGDMIEQEKLDGLIITTPHILHYEMGKEALRRGVGVEMDKPLTVWPDKGEELIETAEENEATLAVGYQKQHQHYGEIEELLNEYDVLGDVESVKASLSQHWLTKHAGEWRLSPFFSGSGNLGDSGSHLLEGILSATGEFDKLKADMGWYTEPEDVRNGLKRGIEQDAYIEGKICREDQDKLIDAEIEVKGYTGEEPEHNPADWNEYVEIGCENGTLLWDNREEVETGLFYIEEGDPEEIDQLLEDGRAVKLDYPKKDYSEANRDKIEDFASVLRGEYDSPKVTGREALKVVAATEAAYKSALNGSEYVDVE